MTLNNQSTRIIVFLAVFASLFFNPISALAIADDTLSEFKEFSLSVQNGDADTLRGVYAPNLFALPVVQQPSNNAGYVSYKDGEATQFGMASQFGNVGLLAHNHLSGKLFSDITVGQEIRLVYGDGSVEYFVVTEVLRYQALQPNSPWSNFRDLDTDTQLNAEQMFKRVYFGDRHVTFQTCIESNGELSWGRLFTIAEPKVQNASYNFSSQIISQ
jgi:hypothetical protein